MVYICKISEHSLAVCLATAGSERGRPNRMPPLGDLQPIAGKGGILFFTALYEQFAHIQRRSLLAALSRDQAATRRVHGSIPHPRVCFSMTP
jgi:hypothetical protein